MDFERPNIGETAKNEAIQNYNEQIGQALADVEHGKFLNFDSEDIIAALPNKQDRIIFASYLALSKNSEERMHLLDEFARPGGTDGRWSDTALVSLQTLKREWNRVRALLLEDGIKV